MSDTSTVLDLSDGISDTISLNPQLADVKRWRLWRYGCVAHYQVKCDSFTCQVMGNWHTTHNIHFKDCRNVALHGKSNGNRETYVIWSNIKKCFGGNSEEGKRNLVPHLVEYLPALIGGKGVESAGIYFMDWYIYMFVT